MNDTVLQVQGLRKNYPAFTLSEVSFSLEAGRIMGFIGRNGARSEERRVGKECRSRGSR